MAFRLRPPRLDRELRGDTRTGEAQDKLAAAEKGSRRPSYKTIRNIVVVLLVAAAIGLGIWLVERANQPSTGPGAPVLHGTSP